MNKYIMPSFTDFLYESDSELLKYMIGGYTKTADDYIYQNKLYPILPHTKELFNECDTFLASINEIDKGIPKELLGINTKTMSLEYKALEYDNIVDRQYRKTVVLKKKLYPTANKIQQTQEILTKKLTWNVVGLQSPLYTKGYIFTQYNASKEVDTFQFIISDLLDTNNHSIVQINPVETWRYSPTNTYENKKIEYSKKLQFIEAIPLFLLVTWDINLPKEETILPLIQKNITHFIRSHIMGYGIFFRF